MHPIYIFCFQRVQNMTFRTLSIIRPAGNYGALTMGSGKEVLDAERPTTENELGTYKAGTGFSMLKAVGESTGREARRARQQADRRITRVRNAAILKGQDPDAAEAAYLASRGKGHALSDTTAKRLDIHHHKPAKEPTPETKRCLAFLKRKREQLQDLEKEIDALVDCGILPGDSAIADRKKERITIYAQMREANKKLDDMAETKASEPSHEDEPASRTASGSNSRFRVPLT